MTGSDLEDDAVTDDKDDDEGIEEDDATSTSNKCSLAAVIQVCVVTLHHERFNGKLDLLAKECVVCFTSLPC